MTQKNGLNSNRFNARVEHLSMALTSAQLHLWEWDIESDLVHRSENHDRLFGLDENLPEFRPTDFAHFIHPDDQAMVGQTIQDALAGKRPYSVQYRVIWPKDNSVKWRWTEGIVDRNESGKPERMFGWTIDITSQKQAEEERAALRKKTEENEIKYRKIFESSPHPKFVMDFETSKIIDVNAAAIACYGYSKDEFLSMHAYDLRPKEDYEHFIKNYGRLRQGQFHKDERIRHQTKDGRILYVEIGVNHFEINGRKMLLGVVSDVTARIVAQEELQKAKQLAESANKAKSQFLANMSHEIRTPMNAILGFADIMDDPDRTDDERAQFLSRIRANGDHLLRLIDDVLDLSKVEAGKVLVEKRPVNIALLLEETFSASDSLFTEKGISRSIQIANNLPSSIYTDATRVRQILANLVSNAVKFTNHGGVEAVARLNDKSPIGPAVEIDIRDTGTGIEDSAQCKLFEPFVQADASVTRRFGGTGLGLALSRRLANVLGGDVALQESQPGVGSTFRVLLPAAQPATFVAPATAKKVATKNLSEMDLTNVKILLAEDSADNEALIKAYLHKSGVELTVARTGAEALEAAEKFEFDLILMDIQMPELDGLEATRRLRANGWAKPVIALTAHALPEEINRSLEAGCNAHISKPVRRHDLVQTISNFVSVSQPTH